MQISTNAFGNYNPYQNKINNVQQTRVQKTESVSKPVQTQKVETEQDLSGTEKSFFAKMYPEKRDEIMDYHYYQRSGRMAGVAVGALIDRRG